MYRGDCCSQLGNILQAPLSLEWGTRSTAIPFSPYLALGQCLARSRGIRTVSGSPAGQAASEAQIEVHAAPVARQGQTKRIGETRGSRFGGRPEAWEA